MSSLSHAWAHRLLHVQESRPAQTDTQLFVQMLHDLKEEQLPPSEEMKRKQALHGMVFVA